MATIDEHPESTNLIKPKEVAKILNVSQPYVYKLISTGMLPAIVWSMPEAGPRRKVVRVRWKDLRAFQEKHRTAA
jgi:hypothetical protein